MDRADWLTSKKLSISRSNLPLGTYLSTLKLIICKGSVYWFFARFLYADFCKVSVYWFLQGFCILIFSRFLYNDFCKVSVYWFFARFLYTEFCKVLYNDFCKVSIFWFFARFLYSDFLQGFCTLIFARFLYTSTEIPQGPYTFREFQVTSIFI